MVDRKWEDALAVVVAKDGPGQGKVTNRTDVMGGAWFKTDHVVNPTARPSAGTPSGYDYAWAQSWSKSGTGKNSTNYTYQIGFSLTPEVGENGSDTALSKFIHEPWAIIGPALNTLNGNSSLSLGSFDTAGMMMRGMLGHLTDVQNELKSWAKEIDVPDSEMQGTAAGALKRTLVAVQQQVAYLYQEVTNYGDIPYRIDDARAMIHEALYALVNAADGYRNSAAAWPANHVHDQFFNALNATSLQFDASGDAYLDVPGLGNPTKADFWSALEQKSKDAWLGGLSWLDTVANAQMRSVEIVYQQAIDVIPPNALTAPPYRDPNAPKPPGTDTNPGDKPPGTDTNPGDKPPGTDTNPGDKPPGTDTNPGDKPPGSSSVTGPPQTNSKFNSMPPPESKTTGPPQTSTGNGTGNTLLDKNNQPIKDSKGNETRIPPGSHINKDGTITGPDGKLLMGADNKPLRAPANSHIGPSSSTGPSSSNSKQQLKEQQELQEKQLKLQKANQQQQLKDQQELQEQQLKQRKAQQAREVEQEKAYQQALSHVRGQARTETSGNGYRTGGGDRNRLNLEETPPRVNERLPTSRTVGDPRTSISERIRARTSANEPNLAAATAARESSAMNRTSSNGQPMMPPMGGGGGGGGGGERDRERRTWLAEDEETWGTSQEAAPGVIG